MDALLDRIQARDPSLHEIIIAPNGLVTWTAYAEAIENDPYITSVCIQTPVSLNEYEFLKIAACPHVRKIQLADLDVNDMQLYALFRVSQQRSIVLRNLSNLRCYPFEFPATLHHFEFSNWQFDEYEEQWFADAFERSNIKRITLDKCTWPSQKNILLRGFSAMHSLEVLSLTAVWDEYLSPWLDDALFEKRPPQLHALKLNNYQLKISTMTALAQWQLETLSLDKVRCAGMDAFCKVPSKLRKLQLGYDLTAEPDIPWSNFAPLLHSLRSLRLFNSLADFQITPREDRLVCDALSQSPLRHLHLESVESDKSVRHRLYETLLRTNMPLESLSAVVVNYSNDLQRYIRENRTLKKVALTGPITATTIGALIDHPTIVDVTLLTDHAPDMIDLLPRYIATSTTLRSLKIDCSSFELDTVRQIIDAVRDNRALRTLNVGRLYMDEGDETTKRALFAALEGHPSLEKIIFDVNSFSALTMPMINGLRNSLSTGHKIHTVAISPRLAADLMRQNITPPFMNIERLQNNQRAYATEWFRFGQRARFSAETRYRTIPAIILGINAILQQLGGHNPEEIIAMVLSYFNRNDLGFNAIE